MFIKLLALIALIQSSLSISFEFTLNGKKVQCFKERISIDTLMVFEVKAATGLKYKTRGYNSKGLISWWKDNQDHFIHSVTAKKTGSQKVCIENLEKDPIDFFFRWEYGVDANDFTQLLNQAHVATANEVMERMEKWVLTINKETQEIAIRDDGKQFNSESIGDKIYLASFVQICVLIALTYLQSLYTKRVLKTKKLI